MDEAARIALTTARDYVREHPEIALVRFVLFGAAAYDTFGRALRELDPAARDR